MCVYWEQWMLSFCRSFLVECPVCLTQFFSALSFVILLFAFRCFALSSHSVRCRIAIAQSRHDTSTRFSFRLSLFAAILFTLSFGTKSMLIRCDSFNVSDSVCVCVSMKSQSVLNFLFILRISTFLLYFSLFRFHVRFMYFVVAFLCSCKSQSMRNSL